LICRYRKHSLSLITGHEEELSRATSGYDTMTSRLNDQIYNLTVRSLVDISFPCEGRNYNSKRTMPIYFLLSQIIANTINKLRGKYVFARQKINAEKISPLHRSIEVFTACS